MIYSFVIIIGMLISKIVAIFDKKMRKFFLLRNEEFSRIEKYFTQKKNKNNKVIWFHAASAGEFEQAKPLIEKFKSTLKNTQIIASFFSPSGYEAGIKYAKLDFCFNLPIDFRKNANRLLDSIRPYIIIYSKYDVWTNLTVEAHKRGVKLALISATLPAKSFRHRFPFRMFFSKAYSLLNKIYAISEADAKRFRKMTNYRHNEILAPGDTRFERVKNVIDRSRSKVKNILLKEKDSFYIVAGSTYKKSEKKLITAMKRLGLDGTRVRLILVPHEINSENIRTLKKSITSSGFNPVCYSETSIPVSIKDNEILIVDVFGILAILYKEADVVFVGGSFKGSIHSVLEPAVFGKPILTGPYISNSYEAIKLRESGGLILCKNKNELYNGISSLLNDKDYRLKTCQITKNFFNKNTGAVKFILKDIKSLL